MFTLRNFRYLFVCSLIAWGTPQLAIAQQNSALSVVSSATFQPGISPNSLATIFGQNLSRSITSAQLDATGALPTTIDGTRVSINGSPAPLVFVSPTQINFLVPADTPAGFVGISVSSPSSPAPIPGSTLVLLVSPGLFTIPCLRSDRAAVLNGVTNALEPFHAVTAENPGDDKRTRLSFFGTGFRYAANPARDPNLVNVANAVQVEAAVPFADMQTLQVEYAGAAPAFAGLDQINVVIPPSFEGAGLIRFRVRAGDTVSNLVSVVLSASLSAGTAPDPGYDILTVAGTGEPGNSGDQGSALRAQLQNPASVVEDSQGNLYIASGVAHAVRRVSADGKITTFAGTGEAGSSGDRGPAIQAQLRRPNSLALDRSGNLYIADADDHKIRRVDANGTISTFAGNGSKGFAGEGGPAGAAQLSSPMAIAVNRYGTLIIADTGNNRIRKVTSDGLISTSAGRGSPGSSGDGNAAYLAELNAPDSLAAGADGTIFVADEGNHRIRRIAADGSIRTIIGGDVDLSRVSSASQDIAGIQAMLQGTIRLALDDDQRMFISDSSNSRIRIMDSSCKLGPAAGNGIPGFSGDGGPASAAQINWPLGLAPAASGDVFFADSNNHRVRKLFHGACSEPGTVVFDPTIAIAGTRVNALVRLPCPPASDTTLFLSTGSPGLQMPTNLAVAAGQTVVGFTVVAPLVTSFTAFDVTASNGQYVAKGTLYVQPASSGAGLSVTLQPPVQIGGGPLTGAVALSVPAPVGGALIALSSDKPGVAKIAASVLVPEGQRVAEFLVATSPVSQAVIVTITASLGTESATASATIVPGGQPGTILSLSISPPTVTGGQDATGTVTLSAAAPAGGVLVNLASNNMTAAVPSSFLVPAGQTTGTFPIVTSVVSSPASATITATSANTVSATLSIVPDSGGGGGSSVTILSLSVSPSTVTDGQGATGTVTLSAAAPSGGAQVSLASNNLAAKVTASVTVSAGQTTVTFPIVTSAVSASTSATITASYGNTASASLAIVPNSGVGGASGTILSLTISPSTVTGGQGATGTVTLSAAAPTGGVQVNLSSNNSAAGVPSSVTVSTGQTTATFPVVTSPVSSSTTATVTASSSNSASANLTIVPNSGGGSSGTILSLSVSPSTVTGGQGATGTVTLTAAAPSGGVQVSLSSNNPVAGVPSSVTIPEGQTAASFPITTLAVTSSTTATISASSANTATAALTVNPAPCVGGLTLSFGSIIGGNSLLATVNLTSSARVGGEFVSIGSSTASAAVPASVAIAAGQSSATFIITTKPVLGFETALISASLGACAAVTATLNLTPLVP